jgi:hypothetical protein
VPIPSYLRKSAVKALVQKTSPAKLRFSIAENKLTVIPVSDECSVRGDAWTKQPFVKVKE